ncbi:hypothetical protein ACFLZG_08035 [Thermodesulfobacteriota bacterium]
MSTFDPEIINIRQEILQLDKQIEDMHFKVYQYLTDRSKYPHPRHEEFFKKIINYKIREGVSKEIETRLENIQYKAANRLKIWKQWFEDDAKGIFQSGKIEPPQKEPQKVSNPIFDKIYEKAQESWSKNDVVDIESKKDFIDRILPELNEVKKNLQQGQKIVFIYDQNTNRAQVKIKED